MMGLFWFDFSGDPGREGLTGAAGRPGPTGSRGPPGPRGLTGTAGEVKGKVCFESIMAELIAAVSLPIGIW